MSNEFYVLYNPQENISFLMVDTFDGDSIVSTECVMISGGQHSTESLYETYLWNATRGIPTLKILKLGE